MKKEKITLIIFGMFVMYVIVITYGLLVTLHNKDTFVTIDNNIVYENNMESNSERIRVLESIETSAEDKICLNKLNKLLNQSLETYVFGEVNLTEFTKNHLTTTSDSLLTYYPEIIVSCKLDETDKNITHTYILNSQYYYESLIEKYRFNHEIKFKNLLHNISSENIEVLGYTYTKISESQAIDYILDKMEAKYE